MRFSLEITHTRFEVQCVCIFCCQLQIRKHLILGAEAPLAPALSPSVGSRKSKRVTIRLYVAPKPRVWFIFVPWYSSRFGFIVLVLDHNPLSRQSCNLVYWTSRLNTIYLLRSLCPKNERT
jgi:hypothetical protein